MKLENADYKFIRFVKSANPKKKYDAVLLNKKTGGEKRVSFGDSSLEHYKDTTGKGIWSHKNHLDTKRRDAYYARHGADHGFPSASFFAHNYLWAK